MKNDKNIRLLYLFNLLKSLHFFGALAVPFFLYRIGTDYTGMFLIETVFSLSMIIFEIPTGVVADRFGRKLSLFLGSLVFGSSFILMGIFRSFEVIVLAEILCGFGMTLLSGADKALLYELVHDKGREKSAAVMARFEAFGTAGMLLGFPAGSIIAGSGLIPYESALGFVFALSGASILVGALIVLFVNDHNFEPWKGSGLKQGWLGFLFIFKKKRLRQISLNFALISSMTFFMFWLYQALLISNNLPVSLMGFAGAGYNLVAMILLGASPFIVSRLGLHRTLVLTAFIPGIAYICLALIPGLAMALAGSTVIIVLKLFRAPLLNTLMNEEIEDTNRATVLSGVSMIERSLTTLMYPLIGLMMDRSHVMTYLALGVLTVVIAAFTRIRDL